MFRETVPGLAFCLDDFSTLTLPVKTSRATWQRLEDDPLSREKLEFRISHMIQLMLRSEGGDATAREAMKDPL